MDTCGIDERLREVYEASAPVVDELSFAARLRRESGRRRMLPAPRPRAGHIWLVAASCLLVVAALTVGTYEAVVHLGGERAVVVITDRAMSPGGTGPTEQRPGFSSADGVVDVSVPVSRDVQQIGFLDLWTQLVATAGIEEGEARLNNFRLSFDYPSGDLATFYLETITRRDGYQLRVDYSASGESLRMQGTRLPEFTPYYPAFPSVDSLLSALDTVEVKSMLARLDIAKSPGTEASIGDDVTGVEIHLADRSDQGTVEIGAQVRAYYYEAGDWVQLGPDDGRRTAEKSDVVLVLRKTREDPNASSPGDYASFVIPAASIGGTVTTSGSAPTTDHPGLSSTTSTTLVQGPKLKWGETVVLHGRTIKVERPVEVPGRTIKVELPVGVPDETGAPSRSMLAYVACSLVTITNTGNESLTCAAAEFLLMGNSSGGSGIGSQEKTLAGHEVLDSVTLQPGESVTRAVLFQIKQGDHPVKVLMGTRLSTGSIHSSTSEWLACWQ